MDSLPIDALWMGEQQRSARPMDALQSKAGRWMDGSCIDRVQDCGRGGERRLGRDGERRVGRVASNDSDVLASNDSDMMASDDSDMVATRT
jgi:hypothetical protein